MKNSILSILGSILIVVFASSCGGNENTKKESEEKNNSTQSEKEETKSQEKDNKNDRELLFVAYADSVNNGFIAKDTLKTSARREAKASIGGMQVIVNYGSPGVKGRTIWNGLVAYDQIWVTGSHTATSVSFDKDIMIEKTKIPAGTYGFFTVPSANEWTLILNKNYQQHLADNYSEKEDLIRIKVKPEKLEKIVQRLSYTIEKKSDSAGVIAMSWEKIKVNLPFELAK